MCGSASDSTRAISCGEMVMLNFQSLRLLAPQSAARQTPGCPWSCPAFGEQAGESSAQLGDPRTGTGGSQRELRMCRRTLRHGRAGVPEQLRARSLIDLIRFGKDQLIAHRRLIQGLQHVLVCSFQSVARIDQEIDTREIGASSKKIMNERGPGLDLRFGGGRIPIAW